MVKPLDKSASALYATGEAKSVDAKPKPLGLNLNINKGAVSLKVVIQSPMIFGRGDSEIKVDVDLTKFGALELGVSRNHITLVRQGVRLFVTDMGSKNGTHINNDALRSHMFYELLDGDRLQLGKLPMVVTFVYDLANVSSVSGANENTQRESTNRMDATSTTYDVRPFADESLQQQLSESIKKD